MEECPRLIGKRGNNCCFNGGTGNTGTTGVTGPGGIPGVIGATGPTGASGTDGTMSSIGSTGPIGATGNEGVPGQTGIAGSTGDPGPIGVTGASGTVTLPNTSALGRIFVVYNSGIVENLQVLNSSAVNIGSVPQKTAITFQRTGVGNDYVIIN